MNENLPPMPPEPPGGVINALDVAATQGFAPPPIQAMPKAPPMPEEKEAQAISQDNNPSEPIEAYKERMEAERGSRVSLNAPTRRLEVPPIPGYHLHWFLERNVPRALQGWYEFVTPDEVSTADRSIGGRTKGMKSEDLGGNRVTQIGGVNEQNQPEQLILMKIRQEMYFDEQRKIAQRNLSIIQQIFHKKAPIMAAGETEADYGKRYTKEAVIDMSNGRFRKA